MNRESARVLVVDDDADVRDIMRLVLTREGYEVVALPSGEEALTAFEVSRPDLMLLDVMMPGIDGHEVCRRIKGDPRWASTPVIMVTARMDLQDVVSGLELGADDYVTKPFFYEELLARVRATLRASAAERALAKKHRTLEALYAITRATTQSLELEKVLQTALKETCAILQMDAGLIRLVDSETEELVAAASEGVQIGTSLPERIPIRGGHEEAIESWEPCVIQDTLSDPRTRDLELVAEGFRSLVTIPLTVPGRVIGTLSVIGRTIREVEPEEIGFLKTVGLHIGVAVENALLHRSLHGSEGKYRRLVEGIPEVVYEAPSGPSGGVSYVSPAILELTGYTPEEWSGGPGLWARSIHVEDRERVLSEFDRLTKHGGERQMEYRLTRKDGQHRWVMDRAKRLINEDGAVVSIEGVLADVTRQKESESQITRQNLELTVLNAVSRAVSQSLDLDEILRQALLLTVESLGFDGGVIHLNGPRPGEVELRAHHRLPPDLIEEIALRSRGAGAERLTRSREVRSERIERPDLDFLRAQGFVSFTVIPLLAKEEVIGSLRLLSRHSRELGENERPFLRSIGQQIGLAIQNAQLYQQTDKNLLARVRELTTLQAVTEIVSRSLEPKEILEGAVNLITALTEIPSGAAALMDWQSGRLTIQTGYRTVRFDDHKLDDHKLIETLPLESTAAGRVVTSGEPVVVEEIQQCPWVAEEFRLLAKAAGHRALVSVPIRTRGRVWGAFTLVSSEPRAFPQSEVNLLSAIGQEIGVAIENARLYEETRQHLEETQTLLTVSQTISGSLDPAEVLRLVSRETARSLGADMVGAYLADPDGSVLRPVAGYHVPKDLVEEFRKHPMPMRDHGFLAEGWERGGAVYTSDSANDPRIDRAWFKRFPHRAVLFIPVMIRKEKTGGIFAVWWVEAPQFTPERVRLVEGIGHQAAIAVENARLYRARADQVKELQRLANEVLEESRAKEEFLMAISHELGTPLTAIKAYIDTLIEGSTIDPGTRQSFLGVVKNEVDRLSRLIGHVLDAARIEWGPLPLRPSPVDLFDLAREVVEEASARREVTFQTAEAVRVTADRDRVKQVIVNLVDNAIKYSPPDRPVHVSVERREGGALVSVTDQGNGIPPALRTVIFEKFKRAEIGTTRETYGAGLGLYISRAIVEAHGGKIWVKSSPGQGSVFQFTLPPGVPEGGTLR